MNFLIVYVELDINNENNMGVRINFNEGRFYVTAPFALKDKLKSIRGRRWDPGTRQWFYPATSTIAENLANVVADEIEWCSPEFNALLSQAAIRRNIEDSPRYQAPPVKTKCFEHQTLGYHLVACSDGYYLAWEMGSGKSKTVVDVVCMQKLGRTLIICPKSVIPTWQEQFAKHGTDAPRVVLLQKGSIRKRTELVSRLQPPYVLVINYEAVWREPFGKWALSLNWDLVVADELHRGKFPNGKASRFLEKLSYIASKRIGLSGTPMPHSPIDLFAQMRFIDAGVFGLSYPAFRDRYAKMGGFGGKQVIGFKNLEDLHERFYSVADRVTKDEVLDLPEQQHVNRIVELSPKARKIYHDLETALVANVEDGIVTASNALVELLRLQQITGGSVKTTDDYYRIVDKSKKEALEDLVTDMPPNDHLVVFARFHEDLNRIEEVTLKSGREYFELSGRVDNHWEWKKAERGPILGVQIRAGSLGVDLTAARMAVFYSVGFSLGDYEQALSRIHRQGQHRNVLYVHLVAADTVDEKIYKALKSKKNVVEYILETLKQKVGV